jgi:hypothetical protein
MPSERLALADILPAPHFREHHERFISASPADVWSALHELRLVDLAWSRALMDLRTFPARIARRGRPRIVTGRFLEEGPVPVLVSVENRVVVAGGLLQPWKLFGGEAPPELDASGLRAFAEPGWVKVGMDFVLESDGAGTRLHTETRVAATDSRTRVLFAGYWLLIRVGSGLIRRDILRAVARRAEVRAPAEGR